MVARRGTRVHWPRLRLWIVISARRSVHSLAAGSHDRDDGELGPGGVHLVERSGFATAESRDRQLGVQVVYIACDLVTL